MLVYQRVIQQQSNIAIVCYGMAQTYFDDWRIETSVDFPFRYVD